MRSRPSRLHSPSAWATSVLMLLWLPTAGCSSTAYEREQARLEALGETLRGSAQRLSAGDVPAASALLDKADGLVDNDFERSRVQSLRQLILGAEQLRAGDGAAAADAWSRIPSPTLRAEVQEKAAGVGVQVPDGPPTAGL